MTAIADGSAAARAGIVVGDEIVSINGRYPRDVIEFHQLVDSEEIEMMIERRGEQVQKAVFVTKPAGMALGIEVSSAVFDRVRTCDNRCPFCFIHQLPKGLRKSLYVRDDDYRLSFLYGNFTTLTRFTELDAERVIEERLSPLFVSIHATCPQVRATMLKNPRGATSLRWLKVLLRSGIEVHGQIVVCPGMNDAQVLEETCLGILDEYPELSSVGVVPLGLSRFSKEAEMRLHSFEDATAVLEAVERWQDVFVNTLGRRMIFAADEYYLLAGREFPPESEYEGYPQQENGIGMAREFMASFSGRAGSPDGTRRGFFQSVDGAPAIDYRAKRMFGSQESMSDRGASLATTSVLTGTYGEKILKPFLGSCGYQDVRVIGVENKFFGGNISVAGLLSGADVSKALDTHGDDGVFLLPDCCLSNGRFLDGMTIEELPRTVEVVPSDGASLRRVLEAIKMATLDAPGTERRAVKIQRSKKERTEIDHEQSA